MAGSVARLPNGNGDAVGVNQMVYLPLTTLLIADLVGVGIILSR